MTDFPKLTQTRIRQFASDQSFERGQDYYEAGAVVSLVLRGEKLIAEVLGSSYEPYRVEVDVDAHGITSVFCSCPYDWGGWCKHIVAVLLTMLHEPEVAEQREPLDVLIADLDREALLALVQWMAELHPELVEDIEAQVTGLRPQEDAAAPASQGRQSRVDPEPFRRQVSGILHGLDHMRMSEAYWHVGSVVDEVRQVLEKAWGFIRAGDGNNALRVLEGITDAYVQDWLVLDGSSGETGEFYGELGPAWTEAVLSAELTATEREAWRQKLADWQAEVDPYGIHEVFEPARCALELAWDDPESLRAAPEGKIERQDAEPLIEDIPESALYFIEELVEARLNVLERQGRHEAYLRLALAEGYTRRYVTKLAQLGRVQEAVEHGVRALDSADDALALAQELREQGEIALALKVAEHGLTLEPPRAQLALWARDLAEGAERPDLALRAAEVAFKAHSSMDTYRRAQEIAGEAWPAVRERLLDHLRHHTQSYTQEAIAVLLHEGLVDEAIEALGEYPGYGVTEMVVDAALEQRPDWCIQACRRQAEPIMDQGKSSRYHHAARWLGKAKAAYIAAGRMEAWRDYLAALLEKHARKYKLRPMLEALQS